MYCKIVSGGEIVDVCDSLTLVRWQSKNGMFLKCSDPENAVGIVSSDGSTIYLLEGAEQIGDLSYATYAEISEDDYISLREQLVENGVLDNQDQDDAGTGDSTETTTETVKKSETQKQIEALQESNQSLQEQIDFLTECILEMSGTVYAYGE